MRPDLNIICLHCGVVYFLAGSAQRCRINAIAAGFAAEQLIKNRIYEAQRAARRQQVGLYVVSGGDTRAL